LGSSRRERDYSGFLEKEKTNQNPEVHGARINKL
jgi:hypothetical protein